jgi:NADH dehydrogenase
MSGATRIVIIGGGFAGTTTARHLEQMTRWRKDISVTLIDTENFFTFTPLLPEVPSGSIQPKHIVFPLRALLRRTRVRQAHVQQIDLERKVVVAAHCGKCAADEISFDHLVISLGAVTNYFRLPGVQEHALTIKSLADATALHAHLIDRLEHADLQSDPAVRRQLLTIVVAGGGFAGVETMAEINDFVRGSRHFYRNIRDDEIRMVLVHSGSRILPEVNRSLSDYAVNKLRKRGVLVMLDTRVLGCDSDVVRLSNGVNLPAGTFLWTAGTAPNPLLNEIDIAKSNTGRVAVEATMAAAERTDVWAIGDSASIPDLVNGGFCPPTAQFALRQGKVLAKNLIATIDGKPKRGFKFKSLGLLAGLGRRSAVAEILGLRFSGFVAWWLWRTIYLLKLPGFERKVRVAIDWTLDLFFPRDIVYLRPLHSTPGPSAISTDDGNLLGHLEQACEIASSSPVNSSGKNETLTATK